MRRMNDGSGDNTPDRSSTDHGAFLLNLLFLLFFLCLFVVSLGLIKMLAGSLAPDFQQFIFANVNPIKAIAAGRFSTAAISFIRFGIVGGLIFLPNTELLYRLTKLCSVRVIQISREKALATPLVLIFPFRVGVVVTPSRFQRRCECALPKRMLLMLPSAVTDTVVRQQGTPNSPANLLTSRVNSPKPTIHTIAAYQAAGRLTTNPS